MRYQYTAGWIETIAEPETPRTVAVIVTPPSASPVTMPSSSTDATSSSSLTHDTGHASSREAGREVNRRLQLNGLVDCGDRGSRFGGLDFDGLHVFELGLEEAPQPTCVRYTETMIGILKAASAGRGT